MKLYLDDARLTPEGWERTYTVEETKTALLTRLVTHLSLDNDLGDLDLATEGYQILDWLEEVVYNDPTFPVPIITIHSSNASRVQSMRKVANKLELIRQQQIGGQ
jgi:DNA-binding NtrC family response regulator